MTEIIWDWNGTLLNDLDLCIESMNVLLKKRNLPLIDQKKYREVFSFPVKDYYQTIGFDFEKEEFEIPAHEYIDVYSKGFDKCTLHKPAIKVLQQFKGKGLRQFVLSAMEHGMLEKTLEKKGISEFFEGVAGLKDHYAVSKTEQGRILIDHFDIDVKSTWLIGDTIHDFEVANALGINCILIADGHQSSERLEKTGARVIPSLEMLLDPLVFPVTIQS